jgi:hypothetical protein
MRRQLADLREIEAEDRAAQAAAAEHKAPPTATSDAPPPAPAA